MTVEIQVATGGREELAGPLEEAVRRVLAHLGVEEGEISVALLEDGEIRELNREHLGHDRPTDVLSFALWDEGEPVLGDVYVGYRVAARQAEDEGVGLREELLRLVIHGTLHVLGYDHPRDPAERPDSEMYRLQEDLLRECIAP